MYLVVVAEIPRLPPLAFSQEEGRRCPNFGQGPNTRRPLYQEHGTPTPDQCRSTATCDKLSHDPKRGKPSDIKGPRNRPFAEIGAR